MSSVLEESEDLTRTFGESLLEALSPSLRSDLAEKWKIFREDLDGSKAGLEKERLDFEQERFELQRDLNSVRDSLKDKISEHDAGTKELAQLRTAFNEARAKLADLEETNTNLSIDNGGLRRERDSASSERSDLADLAERRQHEIDRLQREWKALSEQLVVANNAKCEALVRVEEIESKEISLNYREKRMEEEREYLNERIASLTSELENLNEEILAGKREQSKVIADIQAEYGSKIEYAKNFEAEEAALKKDVENQQKRAEELAKRLKVARNSEAALEENFRKELEAQTKLAELYKEHSEDAKKKHEELQRAVEKLQLLLKKSSEKYGELESKMELSQAESSAELKKRNEAIKLLRKELENSNDLIKNFNKKGLSPESIENLSPSAAAASKLLKSGITLTEIYSQLVSVNEELIVEKDETRRLNAYIDQILVEIEQRAPILKQQRDDYERAVAAVNGLTERIDEAREEVDLRKREAEEATRRLSSVNREKERLSQQVKDMGQQIITLVREVEAVRTGDSFSHSIPSSNSSIASADSVISGRLVSFRNVEELQSRNVELLSVVRELSDKVEMVETRLVEEKTAELKKELMDALKQVEELKDARGRQQDLVENIISQRDMYKSIADRQREDPPKHGGSPIKASSDTEKKLIKSEAILNEMEKEFETYRTEKCENEKLLLQQLEVINKDLSDSRAKVAKLSSQEEYNTERFKIIQNNSKSYKNQIELLEARNKKLNEVVAKHECSLSALRDEILSAQSKLSRAEIQLERIKHENNNLKAAEARFVQEKEILYRERKTAALVTQNLNQIKLHLERGDDESKMRLENQNESLNKEINLLRKKIDIDADKFRESVRSWENSHKELRTKYDEVLSKESQTTEENKVLRNDIEDLRKELKECNEKLELAGRSTPTTPSSPLAHPPTSGKIRDLELLLSQYKNEVKSLKDQLNQARIATNQFKDIANSAEKRLTESSSATKVFREDFERRLREADESKKSLAIQLEKIQSQKSLESAQRLNVEKSDNERRQEINSLKTELEEMKEKFNEARRVSDEARHQLSEQSKIASDAQEKYERELLLHAQNVQLLTKYKEELQTREDKANELEYLKNNAQTDLEDALKDRKAVEEMLKSENSSLKEQFDILEKENKLVHERLMDVTTQMSSLQAVTEKEDSTEKSFTEGDCGNSQQLLQIIKYLRQEKEILSSKVEVVNTELVRIKTQKDHLQSQLEKSTTALNYERDNSSASVKSASKHFELVQKVETLSAVMDSNRLLREEKDKLLMEIGELKIKLNKAFESMSPLKEKINALEQKEESLSGDNATLRGEATRWRQRATQLIEKSNKVNPEEFKKVQSENTNLKKQLAQLQTQTRQNTAQVNSLTSKLKSTEEKFANEVKIKQGEITKLTQEKNASVVRNNHLVKRVNDLDASLKSVMLKLEKAKSSETSKFADGTTKQSLDAVINSQKEEIDKLNAEAIKREKETKELLSGKSTSIAKLKAIGRQFKEKVESTEKELTKVKAEMALVENELKTIKASSEAAASATVSLAEIIPPSMSSENEDLKERLKQADELVRESATKITELEEQLNDFKRGNSSFKKMDDLEKEIELIRQTSQQKEQRARTVLKSAKQKIERLHQTNSSLTKEIQDLKDVTPSTSNSSSNEDVQTLKDAYESQLTALRQEKEKSFENHAKEKESLLKRIEELEASREGSNTSSALPPQQQQQQSSTSVSASTVSPASTSSDVQTLSVKPMTAPSTSASRKQSAVQPQAHIQPTRQKVSVRPMGMSQQRAAAATIRASSSSLELPQVSVQPTIVSVSPSSSSASSSLNVAAVEIAPRTNVPPIESTIIEPPHDDGSTPTAMVVPRGHASQDEPQPGPSTASVAPTPKRLRDDDPNEDSCKKPKVIPEQTTTEETQEEEDGEDGVIILYSDSEVGGDTGAPDEEPQEDEEMVEDEEEEVVREEEEEDDEEEEHEVVQDEEQPDDDEGEENNEDEEEPLEVDENTANSYDNEPQNFDDEDNDEEDEEGSIVIVSEDENEDRQDEEPRPGPSSAVQQARYDTDDGVVPSTPRLALASRGRNEGFAEAVSSPSAATSESKFSFSQPVETGASMLGTEGADIGNLEESRSPTGTRDDGSEMDGGSVVPEGHSIDEQESQQPVEQEIEDVDSLVGTQIPVTTSSIPSQSSTDRPRISRTPIVWNSPGISEMSGGVVRGARARRSRSRGGRGYPQSSLGNKPASGGN